MNKNEVLNTILSIPGAKMARNNKTNFVVIPTDEGIVKVAVGSVLMTDTKNHKAFNMDAAVAEYKAWEAETALKAAEKANTPVRPKGPNPEAQARRDELDKVISEMPSFTDCTATDIMNAITGNVAFNLTPMNVGQSAKRLVDKGILIVGTHEGDKKAYYSKA